VIVELIIFFPSLFLVTLFRRTKPRRPRTISPVGEALQTIRANKPKPPSSTNAKERRFLLPWWFLIIAYLLSFLMVATSVMFILITSVRIGNEKVQQWLGSILASFCASVLLTQPLKVLSLALLFMCLCRKKEQAEAFIEEEDPVEDFTVSTTDIHRKFAVGFFPLAMHYKVVVFILICSPDPSWPKLVWILIMRSAKKKR
jgi:hypothetical protein